MSAPRILTRPLTAVDWRGWSLSRGVKGALGCCVPLLAAQWLGQPLLVWAGLIGFWVVVVDPLWPPRNRAVAIVAFILLSAGGCGLAVLMRDSLCMAGAFALSWCLVMIMARVLGETAGSVGNLAAVATLIVLAADTPSSAEAAIELALSTIAGGAWGLLVAVLIGPRRPMAPLRDALAAVFSAEASFVRDLARGGPETQHRGAVRSAIEATREKLVLAQGARLGAADELRRCSLVLADAEGLLEALLALREALITAPSGAKPNLAHLIEALESLAAASAGGGKPGVDAASPPAADDGVEAALRSAVSWARSAARHLTAKESGDPTPVDGPRHTETAHASSLGIWLRPFRDNLSSRSLVLRHALRFALTGALLTILIRVMDVQLGHWITITAVMILQPYPSATWQRAVERVAGAVLGGLIAVVAAVLLHGGSASLLAIVPLSLMAMGLRNVSYTLYVVFSTPLFMILVELANNGGVLPPELGGLRILYNLLGATAGMLAATILWPSWETASLRRLLAEDVRCNGRFLIAVMEALQGRASAGDVEEARRRAGLAGNNTEASIRRAIDEPRRNRSDEITAAMAIAAAGRRLAGIAALLNALPAKKHPSALLEQGLAFHRATSQLADAIEGGRAAPAPTFPAISAEADIGRLLSSVRQQLEVISVASSTLSRETVPQDCSPCRSG